MLQDEELMRSIAQIYKFIFANPSVHRNVLRKKLLFKGKVASKEKFTQLLSFLTKSGALIIDKENVSINPKILKVGVLQKYGSDFYVVVPGFDKRYKVDSNIARNYSCGNVLDIIIEPIGGKKHTIVLGKSKVSEHELDNSRSQKTTGNTEKQLDKKNMVLGRVV